VADGVAGVDEDRLGEAVRGIVGVDAAQVGKALGGEQEADPGRQGCAGSIDVSLRGGEHRELVDHDQAAQLSFLQLADEVIRSLTGRRRGAWGRPGTERFQSALNGR
jgi:hypothetical protein